MKLIPVVFINMYYLGPHAIHQDHSITCCNSHVLAAQSLNLQQKASFLLMTPQSDMLPAPTLFLPTLYIPSTFEDNFKYCSKFLISCPFKITGKPNLIRNAIQTTNFIYTYFILNNYLNTLWLTENLLVNSRQCLNHSINNSVTEINCHLLITT